MNRLGSPPPPLLLQYVSNGPSFACMKVERKTYWRKIQPPDLPSQIWVSCISDINKIFFFQDMCKGKPMRGWEGVCGIAVVPRIDRLVARWCIQRTLADGSEANHRQRFPIQDWLWRRNLINITNETEQEEREACFHLRVGEARWSVSQRRRDR